MQRSKELTLAVIIPAKNEAKNIVNTLTKLKAVRDEWRQVKVLFYDDGSSDNTFSLGKKYIEQNFSHYQVTRNQESKNLGGVCKQGLEVADSDYIFVLQGQDDTTPENLRNVFKALDAKQDIVIPFQCNYKERPLIRWILSRVFVSFLNFISGLHLNYYNHSVLMKVSDLRKIEITTTSYAYQAEILIKLIKSGKSYVQVPVHDVFDHKNKTSAFKLTNIKNVVLFLLRAWRY